MRWIVILLFSVLLLSVYEKSHGLDHDAGIIRIDHPGSLSPPGLTEITATFFNYGTVPLSSVMIGWSLDSIVQAPMSWNGSLSPFTADTAVLAGTINCSPGFHFLEIWTYMPNGVPDSNRQNDTLRMTFFSGSSMAGQYTVGSPGGDFATIHEAIQTLENSGFHDDVVLDILPGIYLEQLTIPEFQDAGPGRTVTFQSATQNPDDVIIGQKPMPNQDVWVIRLEQAKYIRIKDLTLQCDTGSPVSANLMIFTSGASYNEIAGVKFLNLVDGTNSSCIWSSSGNKEQYNTIHSCTFSGKCNTLIYWEGHNNRESGNCFNNNHFLDFHGRMAHIRYQKDYEFCRNEGISIKDTTVDAVGLYFFRCNNGLVSGNRLLYESGGNQPVLMHFSNCFGSAEKPAMISNNLLIFSGTDSAKVWGVRLNSSTHTSFLHNTISLRQGNSQSICLKLDGSTANTNEVLNNILHAGNGGYAVSREMVVPQRMDYNVLYSPGPFLGYWGTDIANLDAWQQQSGYDLHSLSTDPLFDTSLNAIPDHSVLGDLCPPQPLVPFDIDSLPRGSHYVDPGAIEMYESHDAGIVRLESLHFPVYPGSNEIKVRLHNFGRDTLHSVTIEGMIDTVPIGPVQWSGQLPHAGEDSMISLGQVVLQSGTHNISLWTSMPEGVPDSTGNNDTLKQAIEVCNYLSGVYTVGDSTADFTGLSDAISALQECGLSGEAEFLIKTGTYHEQVVLTHIPFTDSLNTVTFSSESGNPSDVVITYSPSDSLSNYLLLFDSASFIRFENISLRLEASWVDAAAIKVTGGSHDNVFHNCRITLSDTCSHELVGIYSLPGSDERNSFTGNTITGGTTAIRWSAGTSAQLENGNVFEGNTVKGYRAAAVLIENQGHLLFQGNRIEAGDSLRLPSTVLSFRNCDNLDRINANHIISDLAGSDTLFLLDQCGGAQHAHGQVTNNFLAYTGDGTCLGLLGTGLFNLEVLNNTLAIHSGDSLSTVAKMVSPASSLKLRNNIFANLAGGPSLQVTSGSLNELDYNDHYTNGPVLIRANNDYSSLSQWQMASNTDVHSLSIDPHFLQTDLPYVQNDSLNESGNSSGAPELDIDGNLRHPFHGDIGAVEISYAQDAGIRMVRSPQGMIDAGLNHFLPVLANYGTDTLRSVDIQWQLDNQPIDAYHWTGTLAPLDSISLQGLDSLNIPIGPWKLKCWTSLPNDSIDLSAPDTAYAQGFACTPMAGVYIIDSAAGDFESLGRAISRLSKCGMQDDVSLLIMPGVYEEQVEINNIQGLSADNRLLIKGATGDPRDVVLTYYTTDSWYIHTIQVLNSSYISFKHLTIEAANPSYGFGLDFYENNSHHIVDSCIFRNPANGGWNSRGLTTINEFQYCRISNNRFSGGGIGIDLYIWFGQNCYGNQIVNNTISDFNKAGIELRGQDSLLVSNNLITSNGKAGYVDGISYYNFDGTYDVETDIEISRNRIRILADGTSGGAVYNGIIFNSVESLNRPVRVHNNIIHLEGGNAAALTGMEEAFGGYCDYLYNTVIIEKGNPNWSECLMVHSGINASTNILNNIFYNGFSGQAFTTYQPSKIREMENNLFYSAGADPFQWGVSSYIHSLPELRQQTLTNLFSQLEDPEFLDPWHLRPYNNAVNDLGRPLGFPLTDINGNPRDTVGPDVGAIEFGPFTTDLALVSWLQPGHEVCQLSGAEVISVQVRNNGTDTAFGFVLEYSIDSGLSWSTDTVQSALFPGDSLVHTFSGFADFSAFGDYQCRVRLVYPADQLGVNDSLKRMITTVPPQALPILQDFQSSIPGIPGTLDSGWTAISSGTFNWRVHSGAVPVAGTGPQQDHTLGNANGVYVYSDHNGGQAGDTAILLSPCIDISGLGFPRLSFWYHMFGSGIQALLVDIAQGGVWIEGVAEITGPQQTSGSSPWKKYTLSLYAFPTAEKIRFRTIHGNSPLNAIALDDINIDNGPAYDAAVLDITNPISGCIQGAETVEFMVRNEGVLPMDSLPATYQIGNDPPVHQVFYPTLLPGDSLYLSFSTPVNFGFQHDTVVPLEISLGLAQDTVSANDTLTSEIIALVSPGLIETISDTAMAGNLVKLSVKDPHPEFAYYWFEDSNATVSVHRGDSLLLSPQYQSDSFYVQAMNFGEMDLCGTGIGPDISNTVPVQGSTSYGWSASIYTAPELGCGGPVESIEYYVVNFPAGTVMQDQRIYLAHYGPSQWSNANKPDPANMVKVFEGEVSWSNGWNSIALDHIFNYNGSGNLLVYWENHHGTTLTIPPAFASPSHAVLSMAIQKGSNASFPFSAGSFAERPDIRLNIPGQYCSSGFYEVPFLIYDILHVEVQDAPPLCEGDSVRMNLSIAGGMSPFSYQWYPTSVMSDPTLAEPWAWPASTGYLSVMVMDAFGNMASDSIHIIVNPLPDVDFPPLPDICINWPPLPLQNGMPAGGTYSGPGVVGDSLYPSLAGIGTHILTYEYSDPVTACSNSDTSHVYVDACDGIPEKGDRKEILVYPNPFTGSIYIRSILQKRIESVEVYDPEGKLLIRKELAPDEMADVIQFDPGRISPGLYYLKIRGEGLQGLIPIIRH